MKLRNYQERAIKMATRRLLEVPRVALVLPTGSGKTVVASQICKTFQPVLWLAHRRELLMQARRALSKENIKFDVTSPFTSGPPNGRYNLLVIDEFHHEGCRSYKSFLSLVKFERLLGITATPARHDKIALRFNYMIDVANYEDLAAQGYLCKVVLHRVRSYGNSLDDLVEWANANTEQMGPTIFFVSTLSEAEKVSKLLHASNRVIKGNNKSRGQYIQSFTESKVQCLISCQVLTEGVDLPLCETVILGRKTKSRTLLSQMIGRALRVNGDKRECNVVEPVVMWSEPTISVQDLINPSRRIIS